MYIYVYIPSVYIYIYICIYVYTTARPQAPPACLEGLVAHKDVVLQGEAKLAALEERRVRLRVLAVCKAGQSTWRVRSAAASRSSRLRQRHLRAAAHPSQPRTVAVAEPLVHGLVGEQPACTGARHASEPRPIPPLALAAATYRSTSSSGRAPPPERSRRPLGSLHQAQARSLSLGSRAPWAKASITRASIAAHLAARTPSLQPAPAGCCCCCFCATDGVTGPEGRGPADLTSEWYKIGTSAEYPRTERQDGF